MYRTRTQGIEVSVVPAYLDADSAPRQRRFVWAYTIEIANHSDQTVKLLSRHWIITDGNGAVHEVRGEGVVGEQPVLPPGGRFGYSSGCPLTTPHGTMQGSYAMLGEDGTVFDVAIPLFPLDSPHAARVLH